MTRTAIRSAIKTALEAHAFFSVPPISVVLDDRSGARAIAMEEALRAKSAVVCILPILGSVNRDQTAQRLAESAQVSVHIRTVAGGSVDAEAGVDAIMKAVLGAASLDAKIDPQQVTDLVVEDTGCLTYSVNFLIPLTQPTP